MQSLGWAVSFWDGNENQTAETLSSASSARRVFSNKFEVEVAAEGINRVKIVFSRPLGGLNDTLCQIRKAWAFAHATGRTLALDTRESGIMVSFTDLFEFLDDLVPILWDPSNDQISEWNSLTVTPAALQGEVAKFFGTPWPDRFSLIPDFDGAIRLPPNNVDSELVIHHQRGGGNQSHKLLKQIRVTPEVTRWIRNELNDLPRAYAAIHVRATDYSTNTQWFLRKVKKRLSRRPVVVCSDNPQVAEDAREIFPGKQLILLPQPELVPAGSPLHEPNKYQSYSDKLLATKHLLRDVAAMSGASEFYYTFIEQAGKFGEPRASGLTRLVTSLVDHPEIRRSFLGLEPSVSSQRSILVAPAWQKILSKWKRTKR